MCLGGHKVIRPDVIAPLRAVAPGGSLHVIDFGSQDRLPAWFRWILRRWLALFHVSPNPGLRRGLDCIAGIENLRVSSSSLYGGYAFYAVARRV